MHRAAASRLHGIGPRRHRPEDGGGARRRQLVQRTPQRVIGQILRRDPRPEEQRYIGQPKGVHHLIEGLVVCEQVQDERQNALSGGQMATAGIPGDQAIYDGHHPYAVREGAEDRGDADDEGRARKTSHADRASPAPLSRFFAREFPQ